MSTQHKVLMANDLINKLKEIGVIAADTMVERVVIDAKAGHVARVLVQSLTSKDVIEVGLLADLVVEVKNR